MSGTKKGLIAIGAVILCAGCALTGFLYYMGNPSTGKKIDSYDAPKRALLVIDIQEDYTGATSSPSSPYRDSQKAIEAVNRTIAAATGKNILVGYVRQEFDGVIGRAISRVIFGGTSIKGNPGTEIDKRVAIISKNIFPKSRGDAFYNPELDAFLVENRVNELYLVGLDAEYCVYSTARGALNRGYKVNIITDAILLGNTKKWDGLMEKYRGLGIKLITSREL